MKNFAAEVMQAAQNGISKNELDQFDLFKYSRATKLTEQPHTAPAQQPASEENDGISEESTPSLDLSELELESVINQVIKDYRPVLEEAMRETLLNIYKSKIDNDSSE